MQYLQCKRCIMDSNNDPDLILDQGGLCNHCNSYDKAYAQFPKADQLQKKLQEIIDQIKLSGKNKSYDCLLGISGGTDSTYMAYLAKELGLRPLIVHFDNGWNSELAVKNIESVLKNLGFDLQTYVINWEEFKDIQLAYFKAGVVDIEAITDHAIISTIYKIAADKRIKYVLNGNNIATEGIYLPKTWVHSKSDFTNIRDIHKKYGTIKLKTYPHLTFLKKLYYKYVRKTISIDLLNYINYSKAKAHETLIKLGWRDYGGKHYESVFTRFYQGYILPNKFHIDKRQFHYSSLICSGQMTKEQALEAMKEPIYDQTLLESDKEFVLKKLDYTPDSFNSYMKAPVKKHSDYKTEQDIWNIYFKIIIPFKPLKRIFR
jgi:N-acetyl sugar amidotransferase